MGGVIFEFFMLSCLVIKLKKMRQNIPSVPYNSTLWLSSGTTFKEIQETLVCMFSGLKIGTFEGLDSNCNFSQRFWQFSST